MQQTPKYHFAAWTILLGLYALGWLTWQDDRAPALLFLAWSAVGIPLYAFSQAQLDNRPRSSRWVLLILILIWMDAIMRAALAIKQHDVSHLGLTITLGPALISLIAIFLLGKKWHLSTGEPAS